MQLLSFNLKFEEIKKKTLIIQLAIENNLVSWGKPNCFSLSDFKFYLIGTKYKQTLTWTSFKFLYLIGKMHHKEFKYKRF